MINQRERNEKITKMKLQTAKVLWQEGRKDATFLLIESIDDPRGDELRDRMGFSDDYEVDMLAQSSGFSRLQISLVAVITAVIFFLIGFVISSVTKNNTAIEATLNEDHAISTAIAPSSPPDEGSSQLQMNLTATSDAEQPTVNAVATQQSNIQANIALSSTARYDQATATENARVTQTNDSD